MYVKIRKIKPKIKKNKEKNIIKQVKKERKEVYDNFDKHMYTYGGGGPGL